MLKLYCGSGGGGTNIDRGGNGGGIIVINVGKKVIINENGIIQCNGGKGRGKAGSDSGGSIFIVCNELENKGTIEAISEKGDGCPLGWLWPN